MKKYSIIYADPPWEYADPKGHDPAMGGITYPTMPLRDIKRLPINELADKDSTLFLWVTMPMLREGLEVIESWGFKYITCAFTWVKLNPLGKGIYSGLGHWTNGNAELCLLGKKGHPKRIHKNVKQIVLEGTDGLVAQEINYNLSGAESIISAPRSRHSAKPDEVRDRIVQLMGDLPRIELFARPRENLFGKNTEGWDCWGNEVESDITL